jgi:hypothetical protein
VETEEQVPFDSGLAFWAVRYVRVGVGHRRLAVGSSKAAGVWQLATGTGWLIWTGDALDPACTGDGLGNTARPSFQMAYAQKVGASFVCCFRSAIKYR